MKFATILREAGLHAPFFPECGKLNVILYNEKDHISEEEDIKFVKPLFAENPDSLSRFAELANCLDANACDYETVSIQITASHVVVFYKTPHTVIFRRTPPPVNFD